MKELRDSPREKRLEALLLYMHLHHVSAHMIQRLGFSCAAILIDVLGIKNVFFEVEDACEAVKVRQRYRSVHPLVIANWQNWHTILDSHGMCRF